MWLDGPAGFRPYEGQDSRHRRCAASAGFIGSHLAETLLDRGARVVGIDNLSTGATANIAHLANRDFTFIKLDVTNYIYVEGRSTTCCTGRAPRARSTTTNSPIPTSRSEARHPQGAGLSKAKGGLRAGLDLRGLRATGWSIPRRNPTGQRQSGLPRGDARSEALRRGDDRRLPPVPRREHHRPIFKHGTAADEIDDGRAVSESSRRPCGRGADDLREWQQTRSFCYITDSCRDPVPCAPDDQRPREHRQPPRRIRTIEEIALAIGPSDGVVVRCNRLPAVARGRPESPQAGHQPGRARCLAGSRGRPRGRDHGRRSRFPRRENRLTSRLAQARLGLPPQALDSPPDAFGHASPRSRLKRLERRLGFLHLLARAP